MFSNEYVLNVLMNNGIDEMYLEDMEGVESGSEEWMDVVSEVIGKDSYGDISEEDDKKIMEFIKIMNGMGIEFI
jgi:hypothetical protein